MLLSPCMLGAVAAFMMIDERDESIYDLMSVTPLGFSGYISNRVLMPFVLSMVYTAASYVILNIYEISAMQLMITAFFSGMQSVILVLLLFAFADDKAKGLTYTKALDIFMVTAVADLLDIKWVSIISAFIPFYWTSNIIVNPVGIGSLSMGFAVHIFWICISIIAVIKRRQQ